MNVQDSKVAFLNRGPGFRPLRAPVAHPLQVPALTEEQVKRIMRDC